MIVPSGHDVDVDASDGRVGIADIEGRSPGQHHHDALDTDVIDVGVGAVDVQ